MRANKGGHGDLPLRCRSALSLVRYLVIGSLEETLPIALQIATALKATHQRASFSRPASQIQLLLDSTQLAKVRDIPSGSS